MQFSSLIVHWICAVFPVSASFTDPDGPSGNYRCPSPAEPEPLFANGNYGRIGGSFTSPNYPNKYPANTECLYAIISDTDAYVIVRFENFTLDGPINKDCGDVFVKAFDGRTTDDTLLYEKCGPQPPFQMVQSDRAKDHMLIQFKTDARRNVGFRVSYFQVNCGGDYDAETLNKVINSTNYGAGKRYPNNRHCIYTIKGGPDDLIKVVFDKFDLEYGPGCIWDWLAAYDGANTMAKRFDRAPYVMENFPPGMAGEKWTDDGMFLEKMCGRWNTKPPFEFVSTGNSMVLEFVSDNSVERPGFHATYEILSRFKNCGGTIFAMRKGNISSPGWPDHYPTMAECEWKILGIPDYNLAIKFHVYDVNTSPQKCGDYVAIYDGKTKEDSKGHSTRFCDPKQAVDASGYIVGQNMLVYFKTDGIKDKKPNGQGYKGWTATYSLVCGGRDYDATEGGTIQSPHFPSDPYPNDLDCQYGIQAQKGTKVVLEIEVLNLPEGWENDGMDNGNECSDYLAAYEEDGTQLGQMMCGTRPVNPKTGFAHVITSSGNYMKVEFKTAKSSPPDKRRFNQETRQFPGIKFKYRQHGEPEFASEGSGDRLAMSQVLILGNLLMIFLCMK